MKKIRILFVVMAALFALTLVLSACDKSDNIVMSTPVDTSKVDDAVDKVGDNFDLDELSQDVNDEQSTVVSGGGDYTFAESGSYTLEGSYGKLTIGADKLQLHLFLNGASFTSLTYGTSEEGEDYKKTQLTITVVQDTINTVTCSSGNAIHVKGSLDINGSGTLSVNCTGKNAVKASKALRIVDAKLSLSAANHAISALSISAQNCTVNISEAGKDGLNAECDDETQAFTTEEGFVALNNVNYNCNVSGDGIQADTVVYIEGGTYNITTNGEFVENTAENREKYDLSTDDFRYIRVGNTYQKVASDYRSSGTMYALKQGCKGVKAGEIEYPDPNNEDREITVTKGEYCIVIDSGTIDINSTDDAIHANSGTLIVNGGSITVRTLDDGLTADVLAKITGGTVTVSQSYEGLEGGYVEISGGNIDLTSSDDGINAASDDASVKEHILISGGDVTVNADGDGIDSNGSVEITGGKTVVYGPTSNGDGGLDSETGIYVNGGTLFVLASDGMTELPVDSSSQYVLAYGSSSTIAAGGVVSVRDSNGNTLLEVTAKKNSKTVIFSSSALTKNSTYSVYVNGNKLVDIKLSSKVTSSGIRGSFGGRPSDIPPDGPGGGGGRPGRFQ